MQDEVNEKTMALCIKGGKISAQILKAALTKLLAEIEKKKPQSKKMGGQTSGKFRPYRNHLFIIRYLSGTARYVESPSVKAS